MSVQNDRVNAVFRELAPAIFEAWLRTAPKQPDDRCTVMVAIPEGMIFQHDRPALEQAIDRLFMVASAEVVDRMTDDFPVPGITVTGLSWRQHQAHVAAIEAVPL